MNDKRRGHPKVACIELGNGKQAIIDGCFYNLINNYPWHYTAQGYAANGMYNPSTQQNHIILMHRFIMGATSTEQIDHINGNKLDNRQANLRICLSTQNNQNKGLQRNSTTGFKGVSWRADRNKYRAYIKLNNKQFSLGYFLEKEDAARAYDQKARELFGDYARTNY